MEIVWAVILGLLILAVLAFVVTIAMYLFNRVFDELMKH